MNRILIVALLVFVAQADFDISELSELANSIEINKDVAQDLWDDIEDGIEDAVEGLEDLYYDGFFDDTITTTADAYKRAVGQYIVSFAKTVLPIYEKELDLVEFFDLNEDCDTDCAIGCTDFEAWYNAFMNPTCMTECGCEFNFNNLNETDMAQTYEDFNEAGMKYWINVFNIDKEYKTTVWEALQEYTQYTDDILGEFGSWMREVATETFECGTVCSYMCTSKRSLSSYSCPSDIVECLADNCECSNSIIEIKDQGSYDYYSLL